MSQIVSHRQKNTNYTEELGILPKKLGELSQKRIISLNMDKAFERVWHHWTIPKKLSEK